MIRYVSKAALLLATLAFSTLGCSGSDEAFTGAVGTAPDASTLGGVALNLAIPGGGNLSTVSARIQGPGGLDQVHSINVADADSQISIFFGSLPAGAGYTVSLSADGCATATQTFTVVADATTPVNLVLRCSTGPGTASTPTGSVSVNATVEATAAQCGNLVRKLVAAPSVQNVASSINTALTLELNSGVTGAAIVWATTPGLTASGGTGSFDCQAAGDVSLSATVTAGSCSQIAAATVRCVGATPPPAARCGDGLINGSDVCDGAALPAGTALGFTCAADCSRVIPIVVAPSAVCGNDIIEAGEVCDSSALPAGTAAGSACADDCSGVVAPAARCGDGVINGSDVCDGAALPAGSPAGATCSANCATVVLPPPPPPAARCGDGLINGSDVCDGAALPASAAAGSTCSADCTTVVAPVASTGLPIDSAAKLTLNAECIACANNVAVFPRPAGAECDTQECADLVECIGIGSATSCSAANSLECYCGAGATVATCLAGGPLPTAPCVNEIRAASGCAAGDNNCVASRFLSDAFALGDAFQIVEALRFDCFAECGLQP